MKLTVGALFFLLVIHASAGCIAQCDVEGWAAVIDMNEFPDPYTDIPVDYLNSERMMNLLLDGGWDRDHIYLCREETTVEKLKEILDWLEINSDGDDLVLLYIFTHGGWMSKVLNWSEWVPGRWIDIASTRKLLIVDTCNSGRFIAPFRNLTSSHLFLSGCSEGEVEWAGLEEEGLPIIGSVWAYYLTKAFTDLGADLNQDGWISVEEAYNSSVEATQSYMRKEVFQVPEFLEMYHEIGVYPEQCGNYPNPVMMDSYEGEMILNLSFYISEPILILFPIIAIGICSIRKRDRTRS